MEVLAIGVGSRRCPTPRTNPILDRLTEYPTATIARWRRQVREAGLVLHDLASADPPDEVPDFIRSAAREGVPVAAGYPSSAGRARVRVAIAGYMARRFGVELDPDREILVTTGSKELTVQLPLLVIDGDAPDRDVLIPDPGYVNYGRGAQLAGGTPRYVPLSGDFVFRPHDLPSEALWSARLCWLNTPANPTGAVSSLEDLRAAYAACRAHDTLVVCDELYADLYQSEPPSSLLQAGREGALVVGSLSKRSAMTGYGSGFVAGCAQTIARLRKLRDSYGPKPTDFVNAAAAAAWSDDAHVATRRERFAARKRLLLDFVQGELGLRVVGAEATFYLWVEAPHGHTGESTTADLLGAGVLVYPGAWQGATAAGDRYVRLAACLPEDQLEAAITAWRTHWSR